LQINHLKKEEEKKRKEKTLLQTNVDAKCKFRLPCYSVKTI